MSTWRGLPAPVPPARHETLASWLHRLAAVHGLNTGDLRAHLGIGRAAPEGGVPGLAGRLAAVTGYPARNLALAPPELRVPEPDWPYLRHLAQRACPGAPPGTRAARCGGCSPTTSTCAPGTGTGPARPTPAATTRPGRWPPRSPSWPRRSARWAAPGGCTAGQPPSTRPPPPPASASNCGSGPCTSRCGPGGNGAWTCFVPGDWRRSLFMAAIFPEVAALAAILAAPPGEAGLLSAARHALGYAEPPNRHDISDALSIWATGREAGRFLQPASAYSPAGHHHDGTPRITEGRLIAERQTATRFRRDRRAPFIPSPGPPMPYACRPMAVPLPRGATAS